MFSIGSYISFDVKYKIRSLGWKRSEYNNFKHKIHYLKIDFNQHVNNDLPQDRAIATRLAFERKNYDPYRHQEMILSLEEPVVISPLSGVVIINNRSIVEDALALPISQNIVLPFLPVALYKKIWDVTHIERAILLRHSWGENNYFHFYNDILPKLALLQELKIFDDYPIIISQKLYNTAYFQVAIQLAGLQDRAWIVQENNYLKVERLVIVRAHELTDRGILRNLKLLKFDRPENPDNRRTFITRSEGGLRNLSNREIIIKIARDLGFNIVDCSNLSLIQQIDLFANSRIIVGEHGAAFSNIIYRYGQSLNILELFPPHHVSTCYFVISQALSYQHDVLRSRSHNDENYDIDPMTFREKLESILATI